MKKLIAISLCVSLLGCSAEQAGPPPSKPIGVNTYIMQELEWQDSLQALGTVRANESITITAKVSEVVERVMFQDGDMVEAGKVLLDLSGRAEVAQLEEARAAFNEASKQFDRLVDLVKQGTIAASQLDQQQALRDAAKARMDTIRARLADRVITAPFAGVLGFRRVSPGSLVTPGTEITTLDDIGTVKLDFSVPEKALASVSEGLTIQAQSAAYPDRIFQGSITSIGNRVDPVSRALTVRARIPNTEFLLRPGMLLTVKMYSKPRQVLILPEIALLTLGQKHHVYKIDAESKAIQTEVQIGARKAGDVEILSGLIAGDQIVTDGIVKLRNGAMVTVLNAAQPAPAASQENE